MNVTNSLKFVPENALKVRRSLSHSILDKPEEENTLLKYMNKKNRKNVPVHQYNYSPQNIPPQAHAPDRTQNQTFSSNGEHAWIKNLTGGFVVVTFTDRSKSDDFGRHPTLDITIKDYERLSKFSDQQLNSYEMRVLYEKGKLTNISEEQYAIEIEQKKMREEDPYDVVSNRKEYSLKGKSEKVVSFGDDDNERNIVITEDISGNYQSPVVDEEGEYDNLSSVKKGMADMYREMATTDNSQGIDDLIPQYNSSSRSRRV